jgi:hypothetical protein
MNCQRAQQLLSASEDGERCDVYRLGQQAGHGFATVRRAKDALTVHLRECEVCRQQWEEIVAFEGKVRQALDARSLRDGDLRRHAIDRWLTQRATTGRKQLSPPSWQRATALGALLFIAGGTLWLARWERRAPTRPSSPALAQISERQPFASSAASRSPLRSRNARGPVSHGKPSRSGLRERPASHSLPLIAPPQRRPAFHAEIASHGARGATPLKDLASLNREPDRSIAPWMTLGAERSDRVQARVEQTARVREEFVQIPYPRLADNSGRLIAEAAESYQHEAAVVDARLARAVTLEQKATALSDLCERLRADTGIDLAAGASVADEKVTVFCEERPLREVMRQLSRPFGYAWLRSGKTGEYRYELVQDLRSQLLEEELRNRDRNAALLALDAEMQRYRKYLGLSLDGVAARARTAPPEEKKLLEKISGLGWGPAHLYFRLSPDDLNRMRSGKDLIYSAEQCQPWHDRPLPPELWRGILESQRDRYIIERNGRFVLPDVDKRDGSEGVLPTQISATRALAKLYIEQSELGQFTLCGMSGCFISPRVQRPDSFSVLSGPERLAVGISPSVSDPKNGEANARLAHDPSLRSTVTVKPNASCAAEDGPRVTSADVLEALHRATGRPVVADFYTRLYPLDEITAQNMPLFDALNRLADRMHLRWQKEDDWLQFRSASYFHDRLKEVPNRLLTRWAASRRQHGALTLDDLTQIAQLTDAQLDAASMAEGAERCDGLAEWELPRVKHLREQLRYLAGFTPAQRQEMQSPAGLAFRKMTLPQQQQFVALSWFNRSLEEFAGWTLRVQYILPGGFEWFQPGWRHNLPPRVRETTRMAALQGARRIDPNLTEAQIVPTRLDLFVCYAPAGDDPPRARMVRSGSNGFDGVDLGDPPLRRP